MRGECYAHVALEDGFVEIHPLLAGTLSLLSDVLSHPCARPVLPFFFQPSF